MPDQPPPSKDQQGPPQAAPQQGPPQQQAQPPAPPVQPQQAQQPQAEQAADTTQRLVSGLQIATQALVGVGQIVAADNSQVKPEDAEVIRNAIVAISRLSERVAASQAQAAPAVGAVPPPENQVSGVGAPQAGPPGGAVQQPTV